MNTQRTSGGKITIGLPKGFTYFIRSGGAIKIGSSMNPKKRIETIKASSPAPIQTLIIVSMEEADEFETHQKFAHLRLKGEWFRAERELLDFIDGLRVEKKPRSFDIHREIGRVIEVRKNYPNVKETRPQFERCNILVGLGREWCRTDDPAHKLEIAKRINRTRAELAELGVTL